MKKIFYILLLIIVHALPSISAAQKRDSLAGALKIEIEAQKDSIASLKNKFYEFKNKKEYETKQLEQNIQQASDTIARQNSLFDGFSYIYSVIGLIVAILLGSSIVYFFVIVKPIISDARKEVARTRIESDRAKTVIDKAENRIKSIASKKALEKKVSRVLDNISRKKIDQNIAYLMSNDLILQDDAIEYFRTVQYDIFTTEQLFKIFTILKTPQFQHAKKIKLIQTVAAKHSLVADEYFKDSGLSDINSQVLGESFSYFSRNTFANYSTTFIDYFNKSGKPKAEAFTGLLLRLLSPYPQYIQYLINDNTICAWLNEGEKTQLMEELISPKYDGIRDNINASLLKQLSSAA